MRLPFLQLESDLLAHGAGSVAVLLGCSEVEALGHVALMRAWAVSRASDAAPPDGWVPGDNAARLVASGARWKGDPMAFVAALADPGVALLEVHRDGIRVLGLEPYAEAWDKNAKARERLRKFRERNANETRTSTNVSGQTQTQTQKVEDLPPASQAALLEVAEQPQKPANRSKTPRQPAGDPRHAPLVKALTDAGYPFRGGRDAKAVTDLLALADQREVTRGEAAGVEILRRARIGWAWVGFPSCRSLTELHANWGHYEAPQQPRGGGGPAPPSTFDEAPVYPKFAWLDSDYGKENT